MAQASGYLTSRGDNFPTCAPPFRFWDLSTTDASMRRVLTQLNARVANVVGQH